MLIVVCGCREGTVLLEKRRTLPPTEDPAVVKECTFKPALNPHTAALRDGAVDPCVCFCLPPRPRASCARCVHHMHVHHLRHAVLCLLVCPSPYR